MFNLAFVRRQLPGREVYYFDSLGSTMIEAATLAARGCAAGTTIVAGEQTAGQGRHGRSWHSERDAGLYASIVLDPALPLDVMPPLTLALGLATAEAIARTADLECDLRWPNDVLAGGRKLAGILVQRGTAPVAGIGINVNHAAFPPDLCDLATSLRIETGGEHSRELLLVNLLESVDSFCRMLAAAGKRAIFDLFSRRSSWACGKRVTAGDVTGVTGGLDEHGFLLVAADDGTRQTILTGGVRAAGP
ncbi:MAG: biotin--[acetyl-CoA-carboxylase] ligase [Bryobacteraceae bacterium]